jgi:hypothetical protein
MYQTPLVKPEIDIGALERESPFPIAAAFWQFVEDINEWYLIVVSPDVGLRGPRATNAELREIAEKLENDSRHPVSFPLDRIYLLSPSDPRYKEMRHATLDRLKRLDANTRSINDMVWGDTHIYRMT